jgi:hypothetical protein
MRNLVVLFLLTSAAFSADPSGGQAIRQVESDHFTFLLTDTVERNPSAKPDDNTNLWIGSGNVTVLCQGQFYAAGGVHDGKMQGRWIRADDAQHVTICDYENDELSGVHVSLIGYHMDYNKYKLGKKLNWSAYANAEEECASSTPGK